MAGDSGKPYQHWMNVAEEPDAEMLAIDSVVDVDSLDEDTRHVRRLISSLEMCHHKAGRWVELILQAIGSGRSDKGPGRRTGGTAHPAEKLWAECACALEAWCDGSDAASRLQHDFAIRLGDQNELKVWQTRRVKEKIRTTLDADAYWWPTEDEDLSAGDAAFRDITRATTIRDTVDGLPAEITLAAAIDHLEPCNWNFKNNLAVVLDAIGGRLDAQQPFACCARNLTLCPLREKMYSVTSALKSYCQGARPHDDRLSGSIREVLGPIDERKCWLALSLDKTIRAQMRL